MFLESLLICDVRIFFVIPKVCVIHVNPREEYTIANDGYYVSCCNTKVSTLVEDMESRFNTLYVFGSLFLWYVRIGKYHRVIVFLILCRSIDSYDDVRVEESWVRGFKPLDRKFMCLKYLKLVGIHLISLLLQFIVDWGSCKVKYHP